jgi:amino acid transporter
VASVVGNLTMLISVSVFFMAIAYLATSASIFWFRRKGLTQIQQHSRRHLIIPALGIAFSVYLISQCTSTQLAIGVLLLLAGVPIYIKYSPKKELTGLKEALLSRQVTLRRMYEQEHVFLAHVLLHVKLVYRKASKRKVNSA